MSVILLASFITQFFKKRLASRLKKKFATVFDLKDNRALKPYNTIHKLANCIIRKIVTGNKELDSECNISFCKPSCKPRKFRLYQRIFSFCFFLEIRRGNSEKIQIRLPQNKLLKYRAYRPRTDHSTKGCMKGQMEQTFSTRCAG